MGTARDGVWKLQLFLRTPVPIQCSADAWWSLPSHRLRCSASLTKPQRYRKRQGSALPWSACMKKNWSPVLLALATLHATPTWSVQPSYESLRREATQARHSVHEFPDFTLIRSANGLVFYYFTKAVHPAHPAVVKRVANQNGGAWTISEQGWSFGPDASRRAMKRWMAQFEELDRRMAEDIERDKRPR